MLLYGQILSSFVLHKPKIFSFNSFNTLKKNKEENIATVVKKFDALIIPLSIKLIFLGFTGNFTIGITFVHEHMLVRTENLALIPPSVDSDLSLFTKN